MSGPVFALVPANPPPEMIDVGVAARRRGECCDGVFVAMVEASPGNALLSEILAARDAVAWVSDNEADEAAAADRLMMALAKLGPTS